MSKKYRNPATGEIFTLEEEEEEVSSTPAKKAAPSAEPETPAAEEDETAEDNNSEENAGQTKSRDKFGFSWTPFDVLEEIDGKDVEKVVLGAALGIGGVLAIKGLFSFFSRD